MIMDGIPCFLRTTMGTDSVGYNNLGEAKAALRTLIALETERGSQVVEQEDGRWVSHLNPTGTAHLWIESEDGRTIRLG
jgi:hypothetical protein